MTSSGSGSVHLVVLIHGLWGSPAHLAVAKEELEKAWLDAHGKGKPTSGSAGKEAEDIEGPAEDPIVTSRLTKSNSENGNLSANGRGPRDAANLGEEDELVIMIAGGMTSQLTYDGVDVCASRVAYEVDRKIAELEAEGKVVNKFSLVGVYLGPLSSRYLVGLLHSRTPSFFDKHHPVSFSTISSPHYGIPRYNTFLSTVLCWLGARVMSRSGEQLWVADKYSDEDPRPLLEIMADPRSVFYQGLEHFDRREIYASAVNDHSVPYPTAAIEPVDHFAQHEERPFSVEADEDGIIRSWRLLDDDEDESKKKDLSATGGNGKGNRSKKKGWGIKVGTLPPVLRYRFPFNYIILLLFPIMLPLIIILILSRQSLDTRRSKRRLQQLSSATACSPSSGSGSDSPIPSSSGLSIQSLREGIRRIERNIESDLIGSVDIDTPYQLHQSRHKGHDSQGSGYSHDHKVDLRIELKDSQLRMCMWLNALPIKKYLTWWPEVSNAHATAIVRDPHLFPAHERGRGLLKFWAKNTLGLSDAESR
ncbi:lipid particle protein [Kwoniella heveanensis CBS 569]|nr:lipid particle protein [Kwoniella heveanensis CBS 569]